MLVVHAITTMVDYFQDGEESVPSWELRVEGRLLEDVSMHFYSTGMCR